LLNFWSGKYTATQQNYPVHELEFRICTDHRSLEYFQKQRNLSGRQARWLDVLSEFDFEILYIPQGVVRASSEYVPEDPDDNRGRRKPAITAAAANISRPVYVVGSKARGKGRGSGQAQERVTITIPALGSERRPVPNEEPPSEREPVLIPSVNVYDPTPEIGIMDSIKGRFAEDDFFKKVIESPDHFKDFVVEEGIVYKVSPGGRLLCIPRVVVRDRFARSCMVAVFD